MSISTCPKCGHECPNDVLRCPNCGARIRRFIFKVRPIKPFEGPNDAGEQLSRLAKTGALFLVVMMLAIMLMLFMRDRSVGPQPPRASPPAAGFP